MRILVRQAKNDGLYLGRSGSWVVEIDAREFSTIQEAGQEAWRFEDTVVVLSYDQPRCQLQLNPAYCVPHTTSDRFWFSGHRRP